MLRAAEYDSLTRHSKRPSKFYVGRRLPGVLAEAGLIPTGHHNPGDRSTSAPWFLRRKVPRLLSTSPAHQYPAESIPRGPAPGRSASRFQLPRIPALVPHFSMTWLNVLALGRKPSGSN